MTTSGGARDLDDVRMGLTAWCASNRPDVLEHGIGELRHATAGRSNETIVIECLPGADGSPGPRLVLRPPPVMTSFPDADFGMQATVQNVVAGFGVPTASPVVVERGSSWLGVPFIVMPYVDGYVPSDSASLFDPWFTEASAGQRRDAQREMVRILAAIHSVDWRAAGLDSLLVGRTGRLEEQLAWWADYLDWVADREELPRIRRILDWCQRHRPADTPPSLLWGDARYGNLVMNENRMTRAVLDWDLATIGPVEMDLGWFLGQERLLHTITHKTPLSGFADADEVARDYEAAIGRSVEDLAWHQIFAVFRSMVVTVRQAAISQAAGVKYLLPAGEHNPLVGIVESWIDEHQSSHSRAQVGGIR